MAPPPPMMMSAMDWTGLYAGAEFGGDWGRFPGSVSIGPTAVSVPGTLGLNTHVGGGAIAGGGQIGYNWQFPNNWVLGAEIDFKGDNSENSSTVDGVNPAKTAVAPFILGDRFTASSSWNGSARVRLGYAMGPVLPYITGGVAFADVSLKSNFGPSLTPAGAFVPGSAGSFSDTLVGWTAGAGLEYSLNPSWGLGAEYRYADYGSTSGGLGTVPVNTTVSAPVHGNVGLQEHTFMVKLNYHFGAPPPPAPPMAAPPPPPPPPKVFIVFFDWDRDMITPEGQAIIQQAADAYKAGTPVQIQVTGYTDRSGSPGYNQRLSERRANNVAKALAALGVPKEQMAVSGRGENDNRVPTADGVREPQNRRVEIVAP
jgi:OOP family OmpA-OmpF porin